MDVVLVGDGDQLLRTRGRGAVSWSDTGRLRVADASAYDTAAARHIGENGRRDQLADE